MAHFKVIVQVYKEFEFEAPSQLDAMKMADEQMKLQGTTERYNVNHAKDMDKKKTKKKVVVDAPVTPTDPNTTSNTNIPPAPEA